MATKLEQQELQAKIHRHRMEEGLLALRSLLWSRKEAVDNKWLDSSGDELLQYQGEARSLRRLLRILDDGPVIKTES